MATQLQASTPPVLAHSKPGFLKTLPRELRDAVYDLLYQEVTADVEGLQFHTCAAVVELRLISRQFRLEYDERSSVNGHNNHLTITDDQEFKLSHWAYSEPRETGLHCPPLATRATSLTLNLIACFGRHDMYEPCNAEGNIEWHIVWINRLLQSLPHLRNIYVRLHLVSTRCISTVLERAELLQALPNFAGLQIVGSMSLESIGSADDSVLFATWTKQHRLQEDHEAIELYRKRQARIAASAAEELE